MPEIDTLRECFRHSDWARDQVWSLARGLGAEQLERPFQMGPGSVLAALVHIYGAERIWFQRWQGGEQPEFPNAREIVSLAGLEGAARALADARNAALAGLDAAALRRVISFTTMDGQPHKFVLRDLLLHVCNHGVYHRAQVLNMLRHLGVATPMLDYLFFRLQVPTIAIEEEMREKVSALGIPVVTELEEPVRFDVATIRRYFAYSDWARARVHAAVEALDDAALDRPFEMGVGSLRKTLLHIRDAEQWWRENWAGTPSEEFAKLPASTSLAELEALAAETAADREWLLGEAGDDSLTRVVEAYVRPGVRLRFRVGETMLQLCAHGTHHRAQAANMLRHLGAAVPALDLAMWSWESAPTT